MKKITIIYCTAFSALLFALDAHSYDTKAEIKVNSGSSNAINDTGDSEKRAWYAIADKTLRTRNKVDSQLPPQGRGYVERSVIADKTRRTRL